MSFEKTAGHISAVFSVKQNHILLEEIIPIHPIKTLVNPLQIR
jgi:hypothetical protein